MKNDSPQTRRGYQRRKCGKCGEDLSFSESDPCDKCIDVGPQAQPLETSGIPERLFAKACHPERPNENCSWSFSKEPVEGSVEYLRKDLLHATADKDDYDLAYAIMEEMGLGFKVRNCSCGQLPCARLRPIADALAKREAAVRATLPRAAADAPTTTYKDKRVLSDSERFKWRKFYNDYTFNNCDHEHGGYPRELLCAECTFELFAYLSTPRVETGLEPHKAINLLTALEHQAHRNHEYHPGHCAECSMTEVIASKLREQLGLESRAEREGERV